MIFQLTPKQSMIVNIISKIVEKIYHKLFSFDYILLLILYAYHFISII